MLFQVFIPPLVEAKQETLVLTERSLTELAKGPIPDIEQIESSLLEIREKQALFDENFSPYLTGQGNWMKSNLKSLNTFIPVTKKSKHIELGIKKRFQYGIELGASTFSQKYTNTNIENASTTGVGLDLAIDLYKDFAGRNTRLTKKGIELERKRFEYNQTLRKVGFVNSLRKIYWSIVANAELIKTTEKLLDSSQKQTRESEKKYRDKVADYGEVNRNRALVSDRKARLISLQYQKELLVRQFKELVPSLSDKKIQLGAYSIDTTIMEVLSCSEKIKSYPGIPFQNTVADEIIALLNQEEAIEYQKLDRYDDLDVKLVAEYDSDGRDFSESESFDKLKDERRNSLGVGLQINIPFGGYKKSTKDIREMIVKKRKSSMIRKYKGQIKAFHTQTVKIVDLLREAVRNQRENAQYLSKSLKTSKRKYDQARITIQQLIQEQDGLFQSEMDVIQTNLNVIHTLIDYFSIFNLTPCEINRTKI
jgi:outer membrane protein TolC